MQISKILGFVCLRVDDLLLGASPEGWKSFMKVVDCFNHTGVEWLKDQDICYLGLDMGWEGDAVFLGQQTYFDSKLIPVDESKFMRKGVVDLPDSKRRTMCRQRIGLLLWAIQTRPDINRRICILASIASEAVKLDSTFVKWIRQPNKLMLAISKTPVKIYFRPLLLWNTCHGIELACALSLFTFTDASFGTLREMGSMESYFLYLAALLPVMGKSRV